MPSIAILIPAYNAAATIVATIESIQAQPVGLDSIHSIYIADDASSDETVAIARHAWKRTLPRLHVLESSHNRGERINSNQALTALKNNGIEWVLILHADDLAKPTWLEMMLARIDTCASDVGSICSSWDTSWEDGRIEPGEDDPIRSIVYVKGSDATVCHTLLQGCWWHLSGCAIRLHSFETIGGFHPQLPQMGDWEWLLRCLKDGWTIAYIPQTLLIYRQHNTSVSAQSFRIDRDIRERLLIIRRYRSILGQRRFIAQHVRYIQWVIWRIGRAILNRSPERILLAGQTLILIIGNIVIR